MPDSNWSTTPKYPQIAADYEKTFRVLQSLPVDLFLGAHGAYYGMNAKYALIKPNGPNPFIDSEGYHAYVAEREQAFRAEWEKQKGNVKIGKETPWTRQLSTSSPILSAERQEFYQRLDGKNTAPLWEYLARLVTPEPQTACVPALWRYQDMRPLLMEAGDLISAKEAERRVLVLENPGLRGESKITSSLYSGIQLVMPGEIAPTHRHTASALRFVLESDGGFTAVDGERTTMHPGDFILTPNWTYHDHGNPGTKPTVWLDGLDLHIVNLLGASFASHHPQEIQPLTRPDGDASVRYGANLLPVEYKSSSQAAPLFCYPYSRSREALEMLHRNGPLDPLHGAKLQYINPVTGGYPMPTIAAFLQLLPKGFPGRGLPCHGCDRLLCRGRIGPQPCRHADVRLERTRRFRSAFLVPRVPPGRRRRGAV